MSKLPYRCAVILAAASLMAGCSSYQPTKNVWKSTKDFWYTYVSPPAQVDYDEKGELSPRALALTSCMMGMDVELGKLERVMINADKPPTREWLDALFASFPWINGVAGVKYDGTIIGQEPAASLKQLDFIPLLYEDKKQSSRALRADVQASPLGPEVMLATPLFDGINFLGVVAVHFDIQNLLSFSTSPEDIVILSPQGLLWPGKFDYAATPLAGVQWDEVVRKSTTGTCSNETGSFYYMVRYLGNMPLIFAVVESGEFPLGTPEKAQAFYPKEREKLAPPPMPERKEGEDSAAPSPSFGAPEDGEPDPVLPEAAAGAAAGGDPFLQAPPQQVQERRPAPRPRPQPRRRIQIDPRALQVPELPEPGESFEAQQPTIKTPSPFGPRHDASAAPASDASSSVESSVDTSTDTSSDASSAPDTATAPSTAPEAAPSAPASEAKAAPEAASAPAPESAPSAAPSSSGVTPRATLPSGRPSPFGPR